MGDAAALVVFRGLFVAGLCYLWLQTARRVGADLGLAAALTALAWTAALPRLQLRPELFVLGCQAALGYLWAGPAAAKRKQLSCVLWGWLAANLHPGLACLVALVAVAYLAQQRGRRPAYCMVACAMALFATPYTWRVLPFVWQHVDYFRQGVLPNPEHQPTRLTYFASATGLATLWIMGRAARGLMRSYRTQGAVLLPPVVAANAAFLLLAVGRARAWPFACQFALPSAARQQPLPTTAPWPQRLRNILAAAGVVTSCVSLAPAWGFGLDTGAYPVRAAAYLQEHRSRGQLLHSYIDGAYLVWALRDRPLFVDTRETLFWAFEAQLQTAFTSSAAMQSMT